MEGGSGVGGGLGFGGGVGSHGSEGLGRGQGRSRVSGGGLGSVEDQVWGSRVRGDPRLEGVGHGSEELERGQGRSGGLRFGWGSGVQCPEPRFGEEGWGWGGGGPELGEGGPGSEGT